MSNQDIADQTNEILFKEYFKNLNEKLLNNSDLERIAPGIAKTLIENAKSILFVRKICSEIENELRMHLDEYEANLKKRYKVKSLVKDWIYEAIQLERVNFFNNFTK
jgi:hypothetical protein